MSLSYLAQTEELGRDNPNIVKSKDGAVHTITLWVQKFTAFHFVGDAKSSDTHSGPQGWSGTCWLPTKECLLIFFSL